MRIERGSWRYSDASDPGWACSYSSRTVFTLSTIGSCDPRVMVAMITSFRPPIGRFAARQEEIVRTRLDHLGRDRISTADPSFPRIETPLRHPEALNARSEQGGVGVCADRVRILS